uniref:Uncharacterized protein n=1 Tax=Romanomermis culicivorax TaxID=13658 RepID=A0A915ISM6_ROMCU
MDKSTTSRDTQEVAKNVIFKEKQSFSIPAPVYSQAFYLASEFFPFSEAVKPLLLLATFCLSLSRSQSSRQLLLPAHRPRIPIPPLHCSPFDCP